MRRMCRLAGFLGQQITLDDLVKGPPHGLYHQSYAARELETSVVSADGWGAAWYLEGDPVPCIYRSTLPIWGDANAPELGRAVSSRCFLAAVRSATDPLGIAMHNTQPFRFEALTFVHNGYVERFRETLRRTVSHSVSDHVYNQVVGDTDSEHLFALVAERWSQATSVSPKRRLLDAVCDAVLDMKRLASERALRALCTVVVSDGRYMVAVRTACGARSPTLYCRQAANGGVWFASEPLDQKAGWQPVAEDSVILTTAEGAIESQPLVAQSSAR